MTRNDRLANVVLPIHMIGTYQDGDLGLCRLRTHRLKDAENSCKENKKKYPKMFHNALMIDYWFYLKVVA